MPFLWAGPQKEMKSGFRHPIAIKRWNGRPSCLGEPWELLDNKVAQNLMYAVLFGCLHVSFVNDPLRIYLSLHGDSIQYCGSFCFYCFLFFINSLRARLFLAPHIALEYSSILLR